jgi:hypothetical protein
LAVAGELAGEPPPLAPRAAVLPLFAAAWPRAGVHSRSI